MYLYLVHDFDPQRFVINELLDIVVQQIGIEPVGTNCGRCFVKVNVKNHRRRQPSDGMHGLIVSLQSAFTVATPVLRLTRR